MQECSEKRPYDHLLECAAEQMARIAPLPELARAAQEAGVPLQKAQAWFADDQALSMAVVEQQMVLLTTICRVAQRPCRPMTSSASFAP